MKTPKKITWVFALIIAMLPAFIALACKKEKKEAVEQTPTVAVTTPIIDSVTLHKTYPGYLTAGDATEVVARANGTLSAKHYKSGQYVSKGQVLFTLSNPEYANAVKEAEASLSTARAQREYASKHLAALQKALAAEAVSKMDVISAQNDLNQAEAAIATASAELATARTNMGYLRVTAPISGYVSDNLFSVGAYIAGQNSPVTLCSIYNNSSMTASFSIEDSQFEKLIASHGSISGPIYRSVPINFQSPLPHTYTTDLYYVAPTVTQSTGTIEMRGSLKNPYNELRDGMYVTFDMPYGTEPQAILVRDASISTDQLGKYLYVVNDSNKVVYTPIKVGELYHDTLRLVTQGLKPGDRYVTEALLTVRPGMKVNPKLTSNK